MLETTFERKRQPQEVPGENLFEKLAFIEHERWGDWMKHLFSVCDENQNGSVVIPSFFVKRWKQQLSTPYSHLSEEDKNKDREQVQRYFSLIDPMSRL